MISLITASLDNEGLETLRSYGEVRYQPLAETKQMLGGSRLVKALEDVDVFITEADNLREREIGQLYALRWRLVNGGQNGAEPPNPRIKLTACGTRSHFWNWRLSHAAAYPQRYTGKRLT